MTSAIVDMAEEGHQAPEGALNWRARACRRGTVPSGSVKWFLPIALALSVIAGSVEAWPQLSEARKESRRKENNIQLVVDGIPRKTWTVGELMAAKFDWESPKKKVSPAVPLTLILYDPSSGVPEGSVVSVRVGGWKGGGVQFIGPALSHLNELLLKVDVDKGGAWKLVCRDRKCDETFSHLHVVGKQVVLARVTRIEVVSSPQKKPSP